MEIQKISHQQAALLEAYQKGYRVDDLGNVSSENTDKLKVWKSHKHGVKYFYFGVKYQGKKCNIPVHRLQAFQKFGTKLFDPGIQVRHLDGDSYNNRFENIAIGTQSENMMDRPEEQRIRLAKNAAKHKRKWSDEEIEKIKKMRESGHTYKQIRAVYPMALSTLSYILNGKTYPEHMEENCA